jgi:glycosyltransferase involved in cell wall biosynthesis
MRLLITLPWGRRLGGAEAMMQGVLDGVHQTGHETELVFCEDGPWPAECRAAGFRVDVVPAQRLRRADRWATTVARMARIMRRRRPDLILNWSAKTQLYGSPAATLAGMADRVLWWQHGVPEDHWLDRCASALPAIAVGCSSSTCARAQARLSARRRTFVVAPGAPSPIADAESSGGERRARPGLRRDPEHLLACLPPELAAGTPIVGLVGRLEPWKGHDRLLRAQALLRERGQEIHLLLVGGDAYDISPAYARSLPGLVERLGLAGTVTLTGQVPDAGPYVEQMDVLVNASECEPFGIVVLEGMARGVPVVAVDGGGPAEVIEHGATGVLARSGEPAALADALELLLGSAELRETIGRAGRARFERDFTDAAMRGRFFAELEALGRRRLARAGGRS